MPWNSLPEQLQQPDITFRQFKWWKRLCLVSWATAPCVWTLRAQTKNLLTDLLTYLAYRQGSGRQLSVNVPTKNNRGHISKQNPQHSLQQSFEWKWDLGLLQEYDWIAFVMGTEPEIYQQEWQEWEHRGSTGPAEHFLRTTYHQIWPPMTYVEVKCHITAEIVV